MRNAGIQQLLISPPVQSATEPKGVVYTKRWVVELLLDLAGYCASRNLVDSVAIEPAAGNGAFLVPMVQRLVDSCLRSGRHISECRRSLIAYELCEKSAKRARAMVVAVLQEKGVEHQLAECLASDWIRGCDYLFDAVTVDADFVIGNPPYIRLEDIPNETAALYRNSYGTMRGRADVYIAFYEAALRQLKEGGVCAFICADRWLRNQYGAELRRLITSGFSVEIIIEMHTANAFDDEVDAYPAITVISRSRQSVAMVACAGPAAEDIDPHALSTMLQAGRDRKPLISVSGLRMAVVESWFKGADPWPCHSPGQLELLRRLEDRFPALESHAKVGIGVATGNDSVYITRDAHVVESSRLLKLALAHDLRCGRVDWSGHYLVDPWNDDGLVNLEDYPRLRAYFEKHAGALKRRHTATKNKTGWYKTIDRVNHGLTARSKLYIPDIKSKLEPVLDRGETYPHHNLYFVQSDDWDLEVLGALLMSAVGQFFVESYGVRMRGGYLRFQAQYLRRIRVPAPKEIPDPQAKKLKAAFRACDTAMATRLAFEVYEIDEREAGRTFEA